MEKNDILKLNSKDLFNKINAFSNFKIYFSHIVDTIEEEVDITSKPVLLVDNKVDLERKISHNDGYEFASTRNIKYIETSAKTGFNIKEAFNELYTEIYNLKKDDIKTTEESIKLKMLSKNKNKKKYC